MKHFCCRRFFLVYLFLSFSWAASAQTSSWQGFHKKAAYICLASGTALSSVFIHLWSIDNLLDSYGIEDQTFRTSMKTIAVASNVYVISSTKLLALWDRLHESQVVDEQTPLRLVERDGVDEVCYSRKRLYILYGIGFLTRILPAKEALSASNLLGTIGAEGAVSEAVMTTLLWSSALATYCAFNVHKAEQGYAWIFDREFRERPGITLSRRHQLYALGLTSISVFASVVSHLYSSEKGALQIFETYGFGNETLAQTCAGMITAGLLFIELPLKSRALYLYLGSSENREVFRGRIDPSWRMMHTLLGRCGYMALNFAIHYRPATHLAAKLGLPEGKMVTVIPSLLLCALNSLIIQEVQVKHIEDHVLHRYQNYFRGLEAGDSPV